MLMARKATSNRRNCIEPYGSTKSDLSNNTGGRQPYRLEERRFVLLEHTGTPGVTGCRPLEHLDASQKVIDAVSQRSVECDEVIM